jgi:hypothetical protein
VFALLLFFFQNIASPPYLSGCRTIPNRSKFKSIG